MTSTEKAIILFFSTNAAMWGAKLLKKEGIRNRVIPIPRELSSDCGYCLMIDGATAAPAMEILSRQGVEYDRIVT